MRLLITRGYSAAWPAMNIPRFEVMLQISSRMVDILSEQVNFFFFLFGVVKVTSDSISPKLEQLCGRPGDTITPGHKEPHKT